MPAAAALNVRSTLNSAKASLSGYRLPDSGYRLLKIAITDPQPRIHPMPRQTIHSDSAPKAIGPYSQAVRSGNTLYFSGQTPIDPATGALVTGDISAQARRVFDTSRRCAQRRAVRSIRSFASASI